MANLTLAEELFVAAMRMAEKKGIPVHSSQKAEYERLLVLENDARWEAWERRERSLDA